MIRGIKKLWDMILYRLIWGKEKRDNWDRKEPEKTGYQSGYDSRMGGFGN